MLKHLRNWLRNSRHVHVRQEAVASVRECVELIDRFLDGERRYPLEWDDFISWEHENLHIEKARKAIAETEPLFFSRDPAQQSQGIDILVRERNSLAKLAGLPNRGGPKRDDDAA